MVTQDYTLGSIFYIILLRRLSGTTTYTILYLKEGEKQNWSRGSGSQWIANECDFRNKLPARIYINLNQLR